MEYLTLRFLTVSICFKHFDLLVFHDFSVVLMIGGLIIRNDRLVHILYVPQIY